MPETPSPVPPPPPPQVTRAILAVLHEINPSLEAPFHERDLGEMAKGAAARGLDAPEVRHLWDQTVADAKSPAGWLWHTLTRGSGAPPPPKPTTPQEQNLAAVDAWYQSRTQEGLHEHG